MNITTQDLIHKLQTEFPALLREMDQNGDGTIDQNELLKFLTVRSGIPWAVAANMVFEVFSRLDKNRDRRISIHEAQSNAGRMLAFVESIRLVTPSDATEFAHFPRTTFFAWTPMATAAGYQIEVQFEAAEAWHSLMSERSPQPFFQTQFVGPGRGRWQVTALDAQGQNIGQSDWWTFSYRV